MLIQRDRQTAVVRGLYSRLTTGCTTLPEKPTFPAVLADATSGAFKDGFCPLYQAVPKDLTPPFAAFRDVVSKRWGTKTRPGEDIIVSFLLVSQYAGFKELSNIAQAMLASLTKSPLNLVDDGLRVVLFRVGPEQATTPLSDGRTITRVIPIRVIVEDLASQAPQAGG